MRQTSFLVLVTASFLAAGCGDDTAGGGGAGTSGGEGGSGPTTGQGGAGQGGAGPGSTTSVTTGQAAGGGGGGPAACGDGVVDAGEVCDDGGATVSCDADCTAAACGDGTVNEAAGEDCDDGGESATCDVDCTSAACGDAVLNESAGETCDEGAPTAGCSADCTSPSCGDGVVTAPEACDDSGESASCDVDCTPVVCGDGVHNPTAGEQCDGMGQTAVCDADCTPVACGDGTTNGAAGESCDDGGTIPGDGCSATCTGELHPQCSQPYAMLDTADRNVTFNDGGTTVYCDNDPSSPGWVGPGWYRFVGAAGTRMPTSAPAPYSCGTHAAGWLDGAHPTEAEGVVDRQVCWSWVEGPCWQVGSIQVVDCGDHYLYNLTVPLACSYRYCGTN